MPVDLYTLSNGTMSVKVLTRGCTLYEVNVPDRQGNVANVCSNLRTISDYEKRRTFFGALIGRFANRIAQGGFSIDNETYQLARNGRGNFLHGGDKGFDTVLWNVEKAFATEDEATVEFSYLSPDGEEGFPGNLSVRVAYTLTSDNRWIMKYHAETDRKTIVNLTNHTFWNLAGSPFPSILGHRLTLGADRYLVAGEGLIPTGEIESVKGTPLDFLEEREIGSRIKNIVEPQFAGGYDHCFVLNEKEPGSLSFAAGLVEPVSGRTMTVETSEPAIQFYSGNFLDGSLSSGKGDFFSKQSLLCLETQRYPDSPHHSNFPSTLLVPGENYRSITIHTFGAM